jgi:all-trans-retinol dehydrogenase (NAD+)
VKILKEQVENEMGHVDILINNAGILPLLSLREGTEEQVQRIVDVNLTSHIWVNKF